MEKNKNLASALVSGRILARSVLWNLMGIAAPILVALFAIPLLIDGMGKERFGLLAMVWMGVGYFSLFDMGLGRALTKLVAERLGDGRIGELRALIWTALLFIVAFGVLGALIILFGAGFIVRNILNVTITLQTEAIEAFHLLALGLPMVVLTAALSGILEAHQRFALIASIRIPLGVMTFGAPLITLHFTPSLVWATGALLLARLTATGAFFLASVTVRKELLFPCLPSWHYVRPLLSFGGWLTVTNIVGPLMVYFDRFLIGALLTMTAVTYYVTPFEVVTRAEVLPQAVMGVLFPAIATAMAVDRARLVRLYEQASRILLLLILPVAAAFFLFAPEALDLWLGSNFREESSPVVRWLALGLLVNSLARLPFTLLQSAGRPDLVAMTHVTELVPYGLLLWWLTTELGIVGTALAWFIRVLIDAIILNEIARRQIADISVVAMRTFGVLLVSLMVFAGFWYIETLLWKGFAFLLVLCFVAIRGWPIARHFFGWDRASAATSIR